MDVGVPIDVDVAGCPARYGGDVKKSNGSVRGHVTGSAFQDLSVVCLVEQDRDPEFEVEPGGDEKVGAPEHDYEARLGFDEVRILVAPGDALNFATVSHDLPGDRCVGGERGDDTDRLLGLRWRAARQSQSERHDPCTEVSISHCYNTPSVDLVSVRPDRPDELQQELVIGLVAQVEMVPLPADS